MLQWLPWENSDIIPGQGGRRENKARAAESRAFFPACLLPSSLSTPQEPCYVFFCGCSLFLGEKFSVTFSPEKRRQQHFLQQVLGKSNIGTKRKEKVKFFGVRSIYLAPKNFIFFLQWYFTFRGSVVIKAAHRRKFSNQHPHSRPLGGFRTPGGRFSVSERSVYNVA